MDVDGFLGCLWAPVQMISRSSSDAGAGTDGFSVVFGCRYSWFLGQAPVQVRMVLQSSSGAGTDGFNGFSEPRLIT